MEDTLIYACDTRDLSCQAELRAELSPMLFEEDDSRRCQQFLKCPSSSELSRVV